MSPDSLKLLLKWGGVALAALLLFVSGYKTCQHYTKPVEKIVTRIVTIQVAPPDTAPKDPVVDHGVVTPGVHFGTANDQPVQPPTTIPPLTNPTSTTTITVQVPVPMKLQVFHQTELKWERHGDSYNVWNDSRVWTRDEKGQALEGITSDTLYNKEAQIQLPVSFIVKVPKERPWAAGGVIHFNPKGYGAFLDRDISYIRVGVEGIYTPSATPNRDSFSGSAKLGIRW